MRTAPDATEPAFTSLQNIPYDEHMRSVDFYTLLSLLPKEEMCCDMATD